ncbi:MAG: 30S ribosomal protein S12 methylthiotransferase RimO [Bacteroidales bacterium]|nr:30S ribosomal protein S12 methylthiotransferase RimO [Bacteroidales bacterium]
MKTKVKDNIINIVTLGCSKNLVDSEYLMKQLQGNKLKVLHNSNSEKAKTVIINTCGFIKDAKEESIDTILQYVKAKEDGIIDNVFVMGCLSERYKNDLRTEIPAVDQFFGTNDLKQIVESLGADYKTELVGERLLTTPSHYAYLKISEGCDRTCSFCAIPLMRGKHRSKSIENLVSETEYLTNNGAKEIILIAQDLTYYGVDIYRRQRLADLLRELSKIHGIEWLRLHYAYPAQFPKDIIQVIKDHPNICNYLDIPFQHISNHVLKNMRRNHTKQQTYDLIDFIRKEIPDITLRTTLLVGHPGEEEKDFDELKEFVSSVRFDRLGIFTYSEEEDTYAARNFKDSVPEDVKNFRAEEIMNLQNNISKELNDKKIGSVYKVIIDREEGEFYVGRTEADSPEVDNEVLIRSAKKLNIGYFYFVKISEALDYDLFGEIEA